MPTRIATLGSALRWAGAVFVLFFGFGLVLLGVPTLGMAAILLGALLGTTGAALEAGKQRLSWRVALLPLLYLLLYLYDAVALLLGLPFILLSIILGPIAMLAGILALAMLGVWVAEQLFGDIRGLSSFDNGGQALVAAGVVLLALGSLILHARMGEGGPLELAARLLRHFHDVLCQAAEGLLQEQDQAPPTEHGSP